MSFPAPPPPPGPPPPPVSGGSGDSNARGMLLQSIRKGTTLKKTVTSDRSAPSIQGKPSIGMSNSTGHNISSNNNNNEGSRSNGLGGLFSEGMPKLRPTGRGAGDGRQQQPSHGSNVVPQRQDSGRRPFPSDVKNRGPPPQPPPANQKPSMPTSASDSVLTGSSRLGSNNSYNSQTAVGNSGGGPPSLPTKPPVGGYGKPNVAPKPPGKPSPPPKKLVINGGVGNTNRVSVTRAQSMRVPRSPPVAPPSGPPFAPTKDLGSYRGGASGLPSFHQSQDSLHFRTNPPPPPRTATLPSNLNHHGLKPAAPLPPPSTPPPPAPNSRSIRPPITRPPPPPSRAGGVNPPMCPPPPPPTSAPPPPPHHRTSPAPPPPPPPPSLQTRLAPAVPSSAPPPPPVRNSSMRNGASPAGMDFEARFGDMFHSVHEFPTPQIFRRVPKVYNSKSVVRQQVPMQAKQQAPQPPMHVQLGSKLWANDASSC